MLTLFGPDHIKSKLEERKRRLLILLGTKRCDQCQAIRLLLRWGLGGPQLSVLTRSKNDVPLNFYYVLRHPLINF